MARKPKNPLVLSRAEFIGYTIITFGLYQLYWGWRAWETVRRTKGGDYNSSVRGFFLPISAFWLFPQIEAIAREAGYKRRRLYDVRILAPIYLLASIAAYLPGTPIIFAVVTTLTLLALPLPMVYALGYYAEHPKKGISLPTEQNEDLIRILFLSGIAVTVLDVIIYNHMAQ
jgi:hypothetical protein